MRKDGRRPDQIRPVRLTRHFTCHAPGSVLAEAGRTRVLCTAMAEDGVPPFLLHTGKGWVTAEYSMLPSSTQRRRAREGRQSKIDGRTMEIQRLIGRSLRCALDLGALGERTIWIDCDVIQADGGTRTAAISGSWVALVDCLDALVREGHLPTRPALQPVAAVSVGLVGSEPVLDLDYEEDSMAAVDMNVVMTGDGRFIEVQGTGEKTPYDAATLESLIALARRGVRDILELQRRSLAS